MNKFFKLVWCKSRNMMVAVSESAKNSQKCTIGSIALSFSLLSLGLMAAPQNGSVIAGSASITAAGNTTTINQTSHKTIINWADFNIGANEAVNFKQPDVNSVALNRIIGNNASNIYGQLNANGKVFLVNPNGITFARGAQVNVAGIIASTLDIDNADFMDGNYRFNATNTKGEITNQGRINAHTVALLGNQVTNQGWIVANLDNGPNGDVALVAADDITLKFGPNQRLGVTVDKGTVDALVENKQLIQADGGSILLRAEAASALMGAAVNNSGTLRARSLAEVDGRIVLLGDMAHGTTRVAGTLDASAPTTGNGGFIETSAAEVNIGDSSEITTLATQGQTGTWLIDPTDFNIVASGGDMTGAVLSQQLGSNHVVIQSIDGTVDLNGNGDIFVNDAISWSADHTLTLTAANKIYINDHIQSTGDGAGLVLDTGLANANITPANRDSFRNSTNVQYANAGKITFNGATPSYEVDGRTFTVINDAVELQAMQNNLSGYYLLGSDLDMTGETFTSIGTVSDPFTGGFSGGGHAITGLEIDLEFSFDPQGLFGNIEDAFVSNIGLENVNINSGDAVGGLAGSALNSTLTNSYVTGVVKSDFSTGGLLGSASNVIVTNSYTGAAVEGDTYSGGLVGSSFQGTSITNSYTTGAVDGLSIIGGLVGYADTTTIENSYATGDITGKESVGGLAGYSDGLTITNSYAVGVTASSDLNSPAGGLIGFNLGSLAINRAFWDTTSATTFAVGVSDPSSSAVLNNVEGLSTADTMKLSAITADTFDSNDITDSYDPANAFVWRIYEGHTTPLLKSFLSDAPTNATNATITYDGLDHSYTKAQLFASDIDLNLIKGDLTSSSDATNVGSHALSTNGLYSTHYDIDDSNYVIDIEKASINASDATVTVADKVYDGNTDATLVGSTLNGVNGETLTLSGSGTFDNANAGDNKDVAVNYSLANGTGISSNYQLSSSSDTLSANIIPAELTVTDTSVADKVYDGTTDATLVGTLNGVNGETLTLSGSGTFDNANAGDNKDVAVSYSLANGTGISSNYQLSSSSDTLSANITPAELTITGTSVADKVYDGTTEATLVGNTLNGVNGETLTLSGSGTFDNANVGDNKDVAVNYSLGNGTGISSNYQLSSSSDTLSANITPAELSITNISVADKVYDGTTEATLVGNTLNGVNGETLTLSGSGTQTLNGINGDILVVVGIGTFSDANKGRDKPVTITYTLSGLWATNASNYFVPPTTNLTADIVHPSWLALAFTVPQFEPQSSPDELSGYRYRLNLPLKRSFSGIPSTLNSFSQSDMERRPFTLPPPVSLFLDSIGFSPEVIDSINARLPPR